jgi:hypothetical protein
LRLIESQLLQWKRIVVSKRKEKGDKLTTRATSKRVVLLKSGELGVGGDKKRSIRQVKLKGKVAWEPLFGNFERSKKTE